jgi:hypothetical protein
MKDAVKQNQNELLNKNNDILHFTYFAAMEKFFYCQNNSEWRKNNDKNDDSKRQERRKVTGVDKGEMYEG